MFVSVNKFGSKLVGCDEKCTRTKLSVKYSVIFVLFFVSGCQVIMTYAMLNKTFTLWHFGPIDASIVLWQKVYLYYTIAFFISFFHRNFNSFAQMVELSQMFSIDFNSLIRGFPLETSLFLFLLAMSDANNQTLISFNNLKLRLLLLLQWLQIV